jgi:hypothetical protein
MTQSMRAVRISWVVHITGLLLINMSELGFAVGCEQFSRAGPVFPSVMHTRCIAPLIVGREKQLVTETIFDGMKPTHLHDGLLWPVKIWQRDMFGKLKEHQGAVKEGIAGIPSAG